MWAAVARAEPRPTVAEIERASQDARYNDARKMLDGALAAGHHGRGELIELYHVAAELACILDGPSAGEQRFRRLLALDPSHPAPARDSPVVKEPYTRARRFIASAGHLEAQPQWSQEASGTRVGVRVTSDPLAMVTGVAVSWRHGTGPFQTTESDGLMATLPRDVPLEGLELVIRLHDRDHNVLLELGSLAEPLRPSPPAATVATATTVATVATPGTSEPTTTPSRRRRLLAASIGLGVVGLVVLGAAIGLDVAAHREFDALDRRCQGACTSADLSTLHREEGLSGASYGVAAVTLTSAAVTLIVDRVRAAHGR